MFASVILRTGTPEPEAGAIIVSLYAVLRCRPNQKQTAKKMRYKMYIKDAADRLHPSLARIESKR